MVHLFLYFIFFVKRCCFHFIFLFNNLYFFLMAPQVFLVGPSLLPCTWRDSAHWTFISTTSSFLLHPFSSLLFNIFIYLIAANNPLGAIVVSVGLPTYDLVWDVTWINLCANIKLIQLNRRVFTSTSLIGLSLFMGLGVD